jgi:hypothetical protein
MLDNHNNYDCTLKNVDSMAKDATIRYNKSCPLLLSFLLKFQSKQTSDTFGFNLKNKNYDKKLLASQSPSCD